MNNTLKLFNIVCSECQKAGVKDMKTNLYVNWEKRFYLVHCLNPECNAYEIYDEKGERIVVPEGEEPDGTVEEKKQVN